MKKVIKVLGFVALIAVIGFSMIACPLKSDPIAVTNVTLDKSALALAVNDAVSLTATVEPNNATDKNVEWSSSNAAVATVDNNGKVKGVSVGTATVTVKTADGSKTADCIVIVMASTPRYGTMPYTGATAGIAKLVYSATDNTNNYYLFLLGHVDYVPIAFRTAVIYNGQTPITVGYSSSTVNETSVSRAVEEARTNSVSINTSVTWGISTEVGFESGVEAFGLSAKVSAKIGTSVGGTNGWDQTNTRSVTNTYTTASSYATIETDTVEVTIGNNNEAPGKYRYSLFATTDVYYVLITNKEKTQVVGAFTAVCARPVTGWGIDYDPDVGGTFAKTASGDLLTIPTVTISQLPNPIDIITGDIIPDGVITGQTQTFDLRQTAASIFISSSVTKATIIGDSAKTYSGLEIIVGQRSTPLTIELEDVRAVGRAGSNGTARQAGENGRPLISMGDAMAPVPDLTIISKGSANELTGGRGGNGGAGSVSQLNVGTRIGGRGGQGGAAIRANKLTITGNANITLKGGDGGNGGIGAGPYDAYGDGGNGGAGGSGGASMDSSDITVNISAIVYALRSTGGRGGTGGNGGGGFLGIGAGIRGVDGTNGAQGASYTSQPVILDGLVLQQL